MRWKTSTPQKSLSSLLSLCQKFSQSVKIWQSSDKKVSFHSFFRHGLDSLCSTVQKNKMLPFVRLWHFSCLCRFFKQRVDGIILECRAFCHKMYHSFISLTASQTCSRLRLVFITSYLYLIPVRWPSVPNFSGQSRILRSCPNTRSFGTLNCPELWTMSWICPDLTSIGLQFKQLIKIQLIISTFLPVRDAFCWAQNAFSARAAPRTSLGKLRTLPQIP